jgi:16S rRNA (guanine527-N7)-methyltransferase
LARGKQRLPGSSAKTIQHEAGNLASTARSGSPAAPDPNDRRAALRLTSVSRETEERLDRFIALLLAWQAKVNLIAPSTIPHLWTRHIADSLQLLPLAPEARCWVDLGSGAGFPGLVLGCALAERPGAIVHLVESNARKAAFLREIIRELRIPAIVHCERIEDFIVRESVTPEVVTARALAPLPRLIELIQPLLAKGATVLLPKGQNVDVELAEATRCWNIAADLVPSKTSSEGRILVVRAAARR